ncbi:lipoprotein [Elizabethkingia anophelis]|uniref:lipoprotein n=1 Tax=Elizabethkingia anophelis TaxID=1117645 RepID=UPI00063AD369|nr:lipoprotein [Elizabethkingia anophelis]
MKKVIFIFSTLIFLSSCSATVNSAFSSSGKPLTVNDKVAFLDVNHKVPEGAKKLGTAQFGDSGFSTDCDFNSNLIKARQLARDNGANIVKVTGKKEPGLWSTCYRIKIEFYHYEGNVIDLPQYQLQIN